MPATDRRWQAGCSGISTLWFAEVVGFIFLPPGQPTRHRLSRALSQAARRTHNGTGGPTLSRWFKVN